MDIIEGTIFQYYDHAVNEAGWDSEEGGYLGDTLVLPQSSVGGGCLTRSRTRV